MTYLNQIVHSDKLVETKVNFFADYYNFAVSQIEKIDNLDAENYLSLIKKIIFQIQTNNSQCAKYIDSYLTHPLIQKENTFFKKYKNYELVSTLFEKYKSLGKHNVKITWIKENSDFETALIRFRIELKKVMCKNSLKSIISYLKCTHDLSEHQNELIHHTNMLVNEFLYTNRAKEDVTDTFRRIITEDIKNFPFPASYLKANKHRISEAKQEYLENRTFDQQFEGILHLLKENKKNEYFIFRVYNVNTYKRFKFKYNKVTFYAPDHPKLKEIKSKMIDAPLPKDFFKSEDMILAVIKVSSKSRRTAQQIAVNTIRKELLFLDLQCGTNLMLESHSYIITGDFKDIIAKWSRKENSYTISEVKKKSLDKNPYLLLKEVNKKSQEYFLNYEHLYFKAQNSENPEDYWHYFETLLKTYTQSTFTVIAVISSILAISSQKKEKLLTEIYLINSVINSSAQQLNIPQNEFLQIRNLVPNNLDQMTKNIKHPFISYLSKKIQAKAKLNEAKSYYGRILWDCYAQRNSMMHNNEQNERGLVLLNLKLPDLAVRFRDTVIAAMVDHNQLNFIQIIEKLSPEV